MLDSVNFGSLTKTSKVGFVSNPISNSTPSFANTNNFFNSQAQDERKYQAETSTVAYANPFSFINGSDNTTVSAFDA